MASVKRKRAKRRPADERARDAFVSEMRDGEAPWVTGARAATKRPPPVVVDEASAAYIKLPVSPEVVAAAREHADNAARLYAIVKSGERVSVAELLDLVAAAGKAIDRDVRKLRGR